MACNEIYQYSMALALMDGIANKGLPISELLSHGDHGLGTFRHMNGEMIMLDGRVYQMKSDGTVDAIDPSGDTISPFAQVTRFQPTARTRASVSSKAGLSALLDGLFPAGTIKNRFVAVRLDGVFRNVTVRTAGGQAYPRQPLAEIGRDQVEHTFADVGGVRGTLVGFQSPHYIQGVGIAGAHLHFITEDRLRGGHVLSLETDGEVDVAAALASRLNLELPQGDEEFDGSALEGDNKVLAAVEG